MSSKINNFSNSLAGFILSFQMFLVKPQFWINNHPPTQYLHKIAAESLKIVQSGPSIFCLYITSLQAPELPHAPACQCFRLTFYLRETEVIRGKLNFPSLPIQIQKSLGSSL